MTKQLDNDILDQRITGALAAGQKRFAELHEAVGYGPVDRTSAAALDRHLDRRLQALRKTGAIVFYKGVWRIGT